MIDSQDRQQLAQAKLFANVSLDSVEHMLESCYPVHLDRSDRLLEPGVENSHLYLILDGELRVYLADNSMPEHAVFGAGDCVGELSLLDGEGASALVLAAQDTRLVAMPHEVLWSLVDCSHGVARNLLAIMAGRMRNNNLALVASQSLSLEFEQASSVDMLTGIHSRRWLRETFPRVMSRCERDNEPLCLLIADIDLFRHFNERYGHLAGDGVLRRVARRLADGLRAQDLVARYGGEEFLMLLPRCKLDDAMLVAERLRSMVAAGCVLETDRGVQCVTLSCGVAQMWHGELLDELTSRVEEALMRAKANGRDRAEPAE